jgi:inner membrane protein
MPTLGHVALGIAGARFQARERPRPRSAVVLTALATFPDLDLLSVLLGVGPQSVWNHRGALHSLVVALAAAILAVFLLDLRCGLARTFLIAVVTAASHGLLDTMTRGGEGVMLLWPLSRSRFVAPWPVLPPSPLGERPFSVQAVKLVAQEALIFAPLIVYAFWPRRLPGARSVERERT